MDPTWIERYGYLAVFLGAVFEGETVLTAAGYAVSQGYLAPVPTFLAAVAGASSGDLAWFVLGRVKGHVLVRRFPSLRAPRARAVRLARRWGRATAFLMRFAYGLRAVLPMTLGASRMRLPRFLAPNLLGSVAFATVYLGLGWIFGESLEEILGYVRPYEGWILLGLALTGAVIWAVREWRLFHDRPDPDPRG